jgi:hypothetical protein
VIVFGHFTAIDISTALMPSLMHIGWITVEQGLWTIPDSNDIDGGPHYNLYLSQSLRDERQLVINHGKISRYDVSHSTPHSVQGETKGIASSSERQSPSNKVSPSLLNLIASGLASLTKLHFTVRSQGQTASKFFPLVTKNAKETCDPLIKIVVDLNWRRLLI